MQRLCLSEFLSLYFITAPRYVLLVTYVETDNATVFIYNNYTILAFSERAYVSVWYTIYIISYLELIEQLLLHIITDNTSPRNNPPKIFVSVNIYDFRDIFYTPPGKYMSHIPFERFRIGVVNTISCRSLYPDVSIVTLLYRFNIAVRQ